MRKKERFIDNGDGTVTDTNTGLMWTKNANPAVESMSWNKAVAFCKNFEFAGYEDWRLPNSHELYSLIDTSQYDPALPAGHPFTNAQSSNYWSSSTYASSTDCAWSVDMYNGYVDYYYYKLNYYYVWPVRGGSER